MIVECGSMGLTVLAREEADDRWTAITLTAGDRLQMPELAVEIPVAEFYDGTDVPRAAEGSAGVSGGGDEADVVAQRDGSTTP